MEWKNRNMLGMAIVILTIIISCSCSASSAIELKFFVDDQKLAISNEQKQRITALIIEKCSLAEKETKYSWGTVNIDNWAKNDQRIIIKITLRKQGSYGIKEYYLLLSKDYEFKQLYEKDPRSTNTRSGENS